MQPGMCRLTVGLAAIAPAADSLFVGGRFGLVDGAPRSGLAKLSQAGTGSIDLNWHPDVFEFVNVLALDGLGQIYVGGSFYLQRLDANGSGAVDATWNPSPNGIVEHILLHSGALFVGGTFSRISGVNRRNLAKISTGASAVADPDWDVSVNDAVMTLALDGSGQLVVGGGFTHVGGYPRGRPGQTFHHWSGCCCARLGAPRQWDAGNLFGRPGPPGRRRLVQSVVWATSIGGRGVPC